MDKKILIEMKKDRLGKIVGKGKSLFRIGNFSR